MKQLIIHTHVLLMHKRKFRTGGMMSAYMTSLPLRASIGDHREAPLSSTLAADVHGFVAGRNLKISELMFSACCN